MPRVPTAKNQTPKTSNKSATKTDKRVGNNIRARRLEMGMTQEQLGKKLGVTFQQVQKYEIGTNRIGSGRLFQIAELLKAPLASFYGGEEKPTKLRTASPFDLLSDPLTMQMAQEFSKIRDRKTSRAVLAIVESLVSA
jgi:transcriptional regulator with XRE-family HTH domain